MMFYQYIERQLNDREQCGLTRSVSVVEPISSRLIEVDGKQYVNFATNDYLALASGYKSQLTHLSDNVFSGAMASPLVTGNNPVHRELELKLLSLLEAPKDYGCMLFSSGFAANSGVIKALFNHKNSNALLFQDRLNHASLLDSGASCQAQGNCRQFRFKHNDHAHLQQQLVTKTNAECHVLAVTEGVFSMDGDAPNLKMMSQAIRASGGLFMVDDAHGFGVLGGSGQGSLASQNLQLADVDILVVTFGKAVGAQGAAVIASNKLIDYFTNFSKEYIYSTHLSPVQTELVSQNIDKLVSEKWRRDKLFANIAEFKRQIAGTDLVLLPSDSAIQPVYIGDESLALTFANELKQYNVWLTAIRYPTVAKNEARLRLTLTTEHSVEDITLLVDALSAVALKLKSGSD